MNSRIPLIVAFSLACMLALQSPGAAFAQTADPSAKAGPQEPVAATLPATSHTNEAADDPTNNATSGSHETSPYPQAPEPQTRDTQTQDTQTQDIRESLRVQQTQEAAKTQNVNQDAFQQPQGAAAARLQPTTGTAASQPAGAALAPAKQKRSRSFLIRLGVLAAAGVAVGAVVALSEASPGKPPGSR